MHSKIVSAIVGFDVLIVSISTGANSLGETREIRHIRTDPRDCLAREVSLETKIPMFVVANTYTSRTYAKETVIIKGVEGHPRVANERDVLRRFQHRTPYLRPLIDEIEKTSDSPTVVLKHLDDHLLNASIAKTLNRKELKYVSRCILEALKVLHEDGYVHTGMKII